MTSTNHKHSLSRSFVASFSSLLMAPSTVAAMMRLSLMIILSVSSMPPVEGFSVLPTLRSINSLKSYPRVGVVHMSEPSDTSSSDDEAFFNHADNLDMDEQTVVDTESSDYTPTASEAVVNQVMNLLPSTDMQVSAETRTAINEALYQLEELNPTPDPARSALLNGVWDLRFVGGYAPEGALNSPTRDLALFLYAGGYSPGVFALQVAQKLPKPFVSVGDLSIAIARMQPRVTASVDLELLQGNVQSSVEVVARLDVMSGVRLRETYESTTVGLADTSPLPFSLPEPLKYTRDLYVTYLDEDILVIRDATGVPEVLVRKDKVFNNFATEPSEVEDMVPPGQE